MSNSNEVEETIETLEKNRRLALRAVGSFLAVLVILGGTAGFAYIMKANQPEAKKKEVEAIPDPVVKVSRVVLAEGGVQILAEGVIESQRVVTLTAEVSGKIIEVNPQLVPGGRVREGEVLARLETADYAAALEQAKAAVADAELAIEQETAKRDQSLRDWESLGKGEPSSLLARKPQLASARARLESAKAEAQRAARNLERTVLRAPFDAVVRQESVEVGAVLAPGTQLATLFSERSLEVELPLRLEDYALLQRDEQGQVQGEVVLWGKLGSREVEWPAQVLRTTGEVERGALTAGVVVGVQAADGEGEFRLPPPGLFVKARLEGQALSQAVVVPREAIRDGDRVAVVTEERVLEFRDLRVVRSTSAEVLVSEGVEAGELVILTRLNNASDGMTVAIEEDSEEAPKQGEK